MAQDASEGVEKVQRDDVDMAVQKTEQRDEGVDRPKGPAEGKPKKVRARVRFGGEEALGPEVQIAGEEPNKTGHDHEHGHAHSHAPQAGRPTVRHDRPDLYEF